MSAETLRKAAALMRERAENATPGPWRAAESPDSPHRFQAVVAGDLPIVNCGAVTGPTGHPQAAGDAAHIASWHPAVALAVADWLDVEAAHVASHTCEAECPPGGCPELHAALAVARTYLNEESP